MLKRDSTVGIQGLGLSYLWNLIPIVVLAALCLTKFISVWNAAILAVIWLVLIQGNAEVFLVAFILAMIIKCFCIEVYKIPTGSMEPTLHGDPADGDRIIANKFGILFSPLKRYDVFLFKFPLDKSTSFIKRVVGLPNEELMIKQGDLYARAKGADKFLIAKKPLKTQESMWIPLVESNQANRKRYNPAVPADAWNLPENGLSNIEGGKISLNAGGIIRYRNAVSDEYIGASTSGSHTVSDIKLSFKLRTEKSGGEIHTTIRTQSGDFSLRLPVQSADSEQPNLSWHFRGALKTPALEHSILSTKYLNTLPLQKDGEPPIKIEPNKDHLIEILNFDGTIYIKVDGKEVLKYDYIISLEDNQPEEDNNSSYQVEMEAKKYAATLWDVNIWRDVYYYDNNGILRENKPLVIPDGKYFAIGDNVPNSKDSRVWKVRNITLKDGTIIKCDAEPSFADTYRDDGNIIRIRRNKSDNRGGDIWGMNQIINKSDVVSNNVENSPFISADEIFGRALFVYWPLKRAKLIK